MGKLLSDYYDAALSQGGQSPFAAGGYSVPKLPDTSPVPSTEAAAYRAAINTPFTANPTPQIQDIYTGASDAYKKAGGGWGGAGMAVLTGLGKLGEVMDTSTGNKILAGMSSNPYLAEGYLNNAAAAQSREIANKNMVFQGNLDEMKAQGEDVKTGEQIAAENQRANASNNIAAQQSMIEAYFKEKGIQVDRDRIKADLLKFNSGQTQETNKFNAQQTQGAQEKQVGDRSWFAKLFGIHNEVTPQVIPTQNQALSGNRFTITHKP